MSIILYIESVMPQIIGTIIFFISFYVMYLFANKESEDIIKGLKGKDGWQQEELLPIYWALLFSCVLFCDIVLKLSPSHGMMYSIDAMGVAVLGTKVYLNTHEKK